MPVLTCSRCEKRHIELELHYNCQRCSNGCWNICLNCYRAGKGCLNWFGFANAAWPKWEKLKYSGALSPGAEQPHLLIATRFTALKLSSGLLQYRLQRGLFCSNCLAWANKCYCQCDICNGGDWGFCFACVSQGKYCTHPLLSLEYKPDEPDTPPALIFCQLTPYPALFSTGKGAAAHGSVEPLTWEITCDIYFQSIQPFSPRFRCFSCVSSRSRLLNRVHGNYDICIGCYSECETTGRISPENGQRGWRRCLQGHRMIIVWFKGSSTGQRRVILSDLVGGRSLQEEASQPDNELQRWSWLDGKRVRLVTRDVSQIPPIPPGSTTDFPPDGGVGFRGRAMWPWFPEEGSSDELLFPAGVEVMEIVDVNEDWSSGVYMGVSGLFPTRFVKREST